MPESTLRAIDPEPIGEGVIEKLEQVIARAREGQVSAVAIAVVERDGNTGRTWSKLHSIATMLGAIDIMKRDILDGEADA